MALIKIKTADGWEVVNGGASTQDISSEKVKMASGLNLEQTLGGVWISFTDEDGNPTSEPYIHWNEEV